MQVMEKLGAVHDEQLHAVIAWLCSSALSLYLPGAGLPCDMNAAEDCYSRAAASGHIKASVHLGYLALQQQAWDIAEQHFEVQPQQSILPLGSASERLRLVVSPRNINPNSK